MKRLLSRHVAVVLLVLTTSVLGGLSVAVVAFGQSTSTDPDATVPLGDYTGTTPSTVTTTPTSSYTTTTPTTTTTVVPTTPQTSTTEGTTTTGGGTKGATAHGRRDVTMSGGTQPSKATGRAPTKLAFTGGEPILIGGFGAALMLTGVALHERRRRRAAGEL